jgi:hypothetical protein
LRLGTDKLKSIYNYNLIWKIENNFLIFVL